MPRRGPAIGTMTGGFTTSITSDGITVFVRGKKLNLDMAPKDENGTIELLEVRDDGMVWASGVRYFDPATDTYFLDAPEHPGSDVATSGSIGVVGRGSVVNIF